MARTKLLLTALAASAVTLPIAASAQRAVPPAATPVDSGVARLRDAALKDDTAWNIVEGLTTEIGPRPDGSAAEARARIWAVARLKGLGFKNVRIETYQLPVWVRGLESAEVVSPYPSRSA
jgi:carboxypeptidase Q